MAGVARWGGGVLFFLDEEGESFGVGCGLEDDVSGHFGERGDVILGVGVGGEDAEDLPGRQIGEGFLGPQDRQGTAEPGEIDVGVRGHGGVIILFWGGVERLAL